MRVGVIGVGAVGGYFGARLTEAGRDVVFIARGETLAALRADGLQVWSPLGDFSATGVEATDDLAALADVDLVVIAVKAHQLSAVASAMGSTLGAAATVLPLQNGIGSFDLLARSMGPERVVHGSCRILSNAAAPAVVHHLGGDPTLLCGVPGDLASARVAVVREVCEAVPGMTLEVPKDIRRSLWEKFVFVAPFGIVGGTSRSEVGVLRSSPTTRALLVQSMREVAQVGRAAGVALPADAHDRALREIDALPPAATASLQRDLIAGRPSELTGQFGPLFELATRFGVPVPVNAGLYASLLPADQAARGVVEHAD